MAKTVINRGHTCGNLPVNLLLLWYLDIFYSALINVKPKGRIANGKGFEQNDHAIVKFPGFRRVILVKSSKEFPSPEKFELGTHRRIKFSPTGEKGKWLMSRYCLPPPSPAEVYTDGLF